MTFEREVQRRIDGPRVTMSRASWRAGRLQSPGAPLVLLACATDESDRLRQAWAGQAIEVESCADLAVALVRAGQFGPDIIVVGECGGLIAPREFVHTLRRIDTQTPVIIGVARSAASSASELTAAGATAVLPRPFSPEQVVRLLPDPGLPGGSLRVRPFPIDLGRLRVDGTATRIWVDGVETLLPAMEFLLLRYLAERHGQIVPRDELAGAAWGGMLTVHSNSLAVHVTRVRRRFPAHSGASWIRSVRGCGYQLVVPGGPPPQHRVVDA